MAKTKLIPGFRFHPTDVELAKFFLKRKVMGKKLSVDVIAEVDIYKYAPSDLPDKSCLRTGDLEWYFFCPRGKKYASGARMNRATEFGYWKTTGRDRPIQHNNQTVGMIKTLVFHTGKAPHGDRTNWVMHEFRLEDKDLTDKGIPQDSYVICKVFQKEGPGPRNGAQYGKPFNEEDWDDEEVEIDCVESVPFAVVSAPVPILPMTSNSSVPNDVHFHASGCIGSTSVSCLSGSVPSPCPANPSDPNDQAISNDDDILSMLDSFKEDSSLPQNLNDIIVKVDNPGQENKAEGAPSSDFFEGLGDLNNWFGLGEDGHGFSSGQKAEYTTNQVVTAGDVAGFGDLDFLELIDLDSPLFCQTTQPKSWSQDK